MSDKKVYWGTIIQNSFYYEEYLAYEITKLPEGIILTLWEKEWHYEEFSTGRADRIFFKYEWILPFINTIRSVPKRELHRGTDDSGYGEWTRDISFNSKNSEITIYFSNHYYERSSPKIEVTILSDEFDQLAAKLSPYATWENDRLNNIYLPHADGFEGYIQTIEPLLTELEKYVPEEEQKNILPQLGKIKTEIEISTESYKEWIAKYTEDKNAPHVRWITKQTGNTSYDVTALVFFKGKLDYQKTISLDIKQIAMINKNIESWIEEKNPYPYKKNGEGFLIEIKADSKYDNYLNMKISTTGLKGDFFEIPVKIDEKQNQFYYLIYSTEAQNVHLQA
ncbi:MAG: hypothetical protein J6N81_08545 [Treponema sp.]|nr:hypothetical protein [Treponema sp.]